MKRFTVIFILELGWPVLYFAVGAFGSNANIRRL